MDKQGPYFLALFEFKMSLNKTQLLTLEEMQEARRKFLELTHSKNYTQANEYYSKLNLRVKEHIQTEPNCN